MALFGGQRDISLFRHVSRELMGDIITQQCAFYKYKIEETKVNLYGEAAEEKYYMGPVLLDCLIERLVKILMKTLHLQIITMEQVWFPKLGILYYTKKDIMKLIMLYQINILWVKTLITLINQATGTQI